jgi:hypothetical protein
MKYLILVCMPLMAQRPDYGATAQPGALYDYSLAARTSPIKAGLSSATPSTCTANRELYIKTDAPAGQQLFICNAGGNGFVLVGDGGSGSYTLPTAAAGTLGGIKIGSGLSIDGSGALSASGGGGGGTINSGAGKGAWMPWPSSAYTGGIPPPWTAFGFRYPLLVPVQMEFRAIHASISQASGTCGGTCGLQFAIYNFAMTSRVAYTTTATSGGTPNINTTGPARFVFGGGTAVSSGVLTLPAGVYWLVWSADNYQVQINGFQAQDQSAVLAATTTTGSPGNAQIARSTGAIGAGTGGSFALDDDLSGKTWEWATMMLPVIALVN